MSSIAFTARGVSPSPQVFSRGNSFFSTKTTSWPALASQYDVAAPDGPPPITRTSWRCPEVTTGPDAPDAADPSEAKESAQLAGFDSSTCFVSLPSVSNIKVPSSHTNRPAALSIGLPLAH